MLYRLSQAENTPKLTVYVAIKNFHMPYTNSIIEPDTALRVIGERFPSLVIETGWAESYVRLKQDIDLWIVGTGGVTKIAIWVKFSVRAASRLSGYIEVARPMLGGGYAFDGRQVSRILLRNLRLATYIFGLSAVWEMGSVTRGLTPPRDD